MRTIKLSVTIFAITLFLMACNKNQPQQTAVVDQYPPEVPLVEDQDDYWAKDNMDLQRVGDLLERSNSPQEFEGYLNSNDGLNNLDLNGDGYVDYVSVDEFEDRGDNQRGLSLFSRFGPDLIQEIATIIFHRDDRAWPGARVLVAGNEQLYGDNVYYETNWADRPVAIVTTLFTPRTQYYRSPYYYDNYPAGYQVYRVVETPVYRSRIVRIYPAPVFIFTTGPSFKQVKIKSPHHGKWMDKVYARLAKPTKEQTEFRKNNPGRSPLARVDDGDRPGKGHDPAKLDDHPKGDRKIDGEKGNPGKPAKAEKDQGKPGNPGKPGKPDTQGKGGGKKDN